MKGQVVLGKHPLPKAFIRIYADSSPTPVQKFETDVDGWVAFQLPLQKFYTIKISKQGYVTKIITADAHMPKSQEIGDFYFEFAMELFEQIDGLDVSMLKEPIAKIFFNTFTKKFDYDYNYTVKINSDLKKMYHDYDLLKKQAKTQITASGAKTVNTEKSPPDTTKKNVSENSVSARKNDPSVTFSIELLSSKEQLPATSDKFKGIMNVKEYQEDNLYKYYMGEYPSREVAEKMKEKISGHFPDAIIISFKNKKKIAMDEAVKTPAK